MVTPYDRPKKLEGLSISCARVKNRHEFGFIGHKIVVDDAWEPTATYLVFCDLRKEGDDRWTVLTIGYTDRSAGCFAALPDPTWVSGRKSDAELFLVDDQYRLTREQIPTPDGYLGACIRALCGLPGGHAYAVSGERRTWKRSAAGQWKTLDVGLPKIDYQNDENDQLLNAHGFDDIAGFSDTDLYACGGHGDLWHFDGNRWRRIALPTNESLEYICCGDDGRVYIATNSNAIIVGQGNRWQVIEQDVTKQVFESIAWYHDRLYISTEWGLYEVKNGKFAKAAIAEGSPYTFGKIDARDGVLLCVSPDSEMSYHDSRGWHKLIYRDRPPRDPKQQSLKDLMDEFTRKQEARKKQDEE